MCADSSVPVTVPRNEMPTARTMSRGRGSRETSMCCKVTVSPVCFATRDRILFSIGAVLMNQGASSSTRNRAVAMMIAAPAIRRDDLDILFMDILFQHYHSDYTQFHQCLQT